MKNKTRYFPEHSLLQEAVTELTLGLRQHCVTPWDAVPRVSLYLPTKTQGPAGVKGRHS